MQKSADVVVIGAGLVGAAIAYGLVSRDVGVLLLDGGDRLGQRIMLRPRRRHRKHKKDRA